MFKANRIGKTFGAPSLKAKRAPKITKVSMARDGYAYKSDYYNSENHKKFRETVINRDKCCKYCGATTHLHAHHIRPRSKGGADCSKNGITLCERCHESHHSHMRSRK